MPQIKKLTIDEAFNIAYGSPEDNDTVYETKVVSLWREKYHMRQMVLVKYVTGWFGFEFFDALDKHGESLIGDDYRHDANKEVHLYPVEEKEVITYEYKFKEKQLETY